MERFFAILKMFLCRDTQLRLHERKERVVADLFKPRKSGGDGVQGGQRGCPRMGGKNRAVRVFCDFEGQDGSGCPLPVAASESACVCGSVHVKKVGGRRGKCRRKVRKSVFGGRRKGAKWGRKMTVFCVLKTFFGAESEMRLHERVEGNVLVRRTPRKSGSRGVLVGQKRVCAVWGVVRPPLLCLSEALAMCLDPLRRAESHST